MPMFALPCASKISHRSRPGAVEFLKWTEVQSCTVRHRTASFSKKGEAGLFKKT